MDGKVFREGLLGSVCVHFYCHGQSNGRCSVNLLSVLWSKLILFSNCV